MYSLGSDKKAQAVSLDIVIGTTIFLAVLAIAVTIWENQNSFAENQLKDYEMAATSARTLNFIVKSPGEKINGGTDWQFAPSIDNVLFIGLAKRDRAIDSNKLAKFVEYGKIWPDCEANCFGDYEKTKAKLLLLGDMNYYFQIYYFSPNNASEKKLIKEKIRGSETEMETGVTPSAYAKKVIAQKRIVYYEGAGYSGTATIELWAYN
ncbi:MAG: hypothetical protein PHD95_02360 [Candidatus ainarchaeum sp.]|nr:hypothetical protein [Candidatus ainarchaeum sp.]